MNHLAWFVVAGCSAGTLLLGQCYFRYIRLGRPSIGVIGLSDIVALVIAIALLPPIYLALPEWVVMSVFAASIVSVLAYTLRPVMRSSLVAWSMALVAMAACFGLATWSGRSSSAFLVVHDAILVGAAFGLANLWAQGGLKARDAAILGGVLAVYDLLTTWQFPTMGELLDRLIAAPVAPLVSWPTTDGEWLGIGLGDLFVATLFSLAIRKAFGPWSAVVATGLMISAVWLLLALFDLRAAVGLFPAMVVLGPLMGMYYACVRRLRGPEWTTRQSLGR